MILRPYIKATDSVHIGSYFRFGLIPEDSSKYAGVVPTFMYPRHYYYSINIPDITNKNTAGMKYHSNHIDAMNCLDEFLMNRGFTLLTEQQYRKLIILV